jgi:hypothetical protein
VVATTHQDFRCKLGSPILRKEDTMNPSPITSSTLNTLAKVERSALEDLVRDHQIQAGIALAVAMNVIHFSGDRGEEQVIWKVGDVIDVLKNEEHVLVSDPDGILCCDGSIYRRTAGRASETIRSVTRVAYIGAVVILAANAVDIQRQIQTPA